MQAASFSHRLFRGSRERSLIGVVKTTSSTGGFICRIIAREMTLRLRILSADGEKNIKYFLHLRKYAFDDSLKTACAPHSINKRTDAVLCEADRPKHYPLHAFLIVY